MKEKDREREREGTGERKGKEERKGVREIERWRERREKEKEWRLLCLELTGSARRMLLPFGVAAATAVALLTATKC